MLDQLVESKSSSDGGRRSGFLLTTLVLVFSVFFGSILYSLFAKDLGMGGEDLELSTLVAPVPVPEDEPPPPEPEKQPEKQQAEKVDKSLPTQTVNMARVDEPIAPDKISTAQNTVKARPNSAFVLGDKDVDVQSSSSGVDRGQTSGSQTQVVATPKPQVVDDDEPPPPKPTPKPTATPPPVPKVVSGGVVNGKAVNLVKPPYPPAAKAVRASGAVNVQVTIDENGNVISASAISGHALLRQAAESAARASKFSPTMLSGQKVKVTGVIVYNFTAQ
ncbi:MAG TPA: energy transducer TonB [Pyrinomonadaceae bacterium]|nr:energy transducer TonB [Pyrinomonadaceae bacterium]